MSQPAFTPVTPHIHRLVLHWWGFPVAVWLVRDGNDWTLVDAGPPGATEVIAGAVAHTAGGPPARIVVTHGHPDHVGSLAALVKTWQAPVWAHAEELPFIEGATLYGAIRPAGLTYRLLSFVIPSMPARVGVDHMLDEGSQVAGMRVLHVPGHAPGMIALHHEADRAVITADTFRFKSLGSAMPEYTYDKTLARQSMRKIAAVDFDDLLPSHNLTCDRQAAVRSAGR